jgi:predicted PurR-regulated permease PerM
MSYPTPQQQRIIWTALTGLSLAAIGAVILLATWLLGHVVKLLYPVLLPIGVAAVIAYILEPVVDWMEKRCHLGRRLALLLLFLAIIVGVILFFVILVPPLTQELYQFVNNLPRQIDHSRQGILSFFDSHPDVKAWASLHLAPVLDNLPATLGKVAAKLIGPAQQIFSWLGFIIGFLFVPLYVYYFLLEKQNIADNWKTYLPIHRSWWRDEVVLVLTEINNYLILFFRGQVLVGLCIGVLTAIGLSIIQLPYALLIGLLAGALSLIPYLGIASTLIPAMLIAYSSAATPTDAWLKPILVLGVFSIVQFCEGFFISPKIMGDRTGLHPVTVIIGILVWSLLLPGLLGPILAIPLTATLRVLMYRYVWLNAVGDSTH